MKKVKNFLKNHWDELIIVLITTILIFSLVFPFFIRNSLDKFDTPGLLSLSWYIKQFSFPDFQGWNPYFFGGFPQGILYPPLFHYLVALFAKIFSLSIAYKLVVSIFLCLIPVSIYEFSLKIYKAKTWSLLNTFILLAALIILPGHLGFNFDGLLDYGLGPSFASISLFFVFLTKLFDKKIKPKLLAIILVLLILTHLLTATVAVIIAAAYLIWKYTESKNIKILFYFSLFTFLLSAFWIVPFIYFQKFAVTGYSEPTSLLYPTAVFVLSSLNTAVLLIEKKFLTQKKLTITIFTSSIISILGIIDWLLNSQTTTFKIPLVHPFRTQIYGILLALIPLTYLIQNLHPIFLKVVSKLKIRKLFQRTSHVTMNFSFLTVALLSLSIFRLDPVGPQEVQLKDFSWNGRIIRAYKISDVLDQSRAVIDKSIMKYPNTQAVDGLLKESSYLAPFYQSLSKNINSNSFKWEKLDESFIENVKLSEKKTHFAADLLWVNSLFTTDKTFPNCSNFKEVATFKTNTLYNGLKEQTIFACDYKPTENSTIIELIEDEVEVIDSNWDEAVTNWWKSADTQLLTDKKVNVSNELNPKNLDLKVDFGTNPNTINIETNQKESHYYLLKISYFPKWKAYNQQGEEVDIIRTSPNLMTIPIKDSVTLKYEKTFIEKTALFVSAMSWIVLISFYVRKLYKKHL